MKLHRLFILLAVAAAGFLCSCNQEPLTIEIKDDSQALMLSPALLGIQEASPRTRAISSDELKDDQLNENKISRLDVFIFKAADGTFVKDYHIGNLTPDSIVISGGKEGYLLSRDWAKDRLEKNVAYKVYVVANSTNTAITTEGATTTEAALKALSTTDADIYKRLKEGAAADDRTYSPNKTFLMNATVDSWTIESSATQLICNKTATGETPLLLERAAVKIVMDVSLSDVLKERLEADHSQYGEAKWKFVNFNTATPELPEGDAVSEVVSLKGDYLDAVPAEDIATNPGHYTLTTYAYPQDWTNVANAYDVAPAILISYTVIDEGGAPHYHYYYIPVCFGGDTNTGEPAVTKTERNKLYKVTAIISSYGSFETISAEQAQLTYEVKNWLVNDPAEVVANATDYLFVTPTKYVFNGGDEDEWLDNTFRYYSSGPVQITDISATFKDRTGATQTDPDATRWEVGAAANGQIVVRSKVPTYGTFRTIKFTVVSGNKSQVVEIRHYPADYIMGISGSWSSYNDDSWTSLGSGSTYNSCYVSVIGSAFSFGSGLLSGTRFHAQLYENGQIYVLGTNGRRGDAVSGATNNQMYVLQITSSNDQYTVGRPQITKNTAWIYTAGFLSWPQQYKQIEYSYSEDDVISPAFMLASQLGVNQGFENQEQSALHCALYKEVASDGTVFTGWRLPTKQEIQYMIDNQNNDVMIEVLGGRYYWTLDGSRAEYPSGTSPNQTYTRCVRDVTEEEIAKLNAF